MVGLLPSSQTTSLWNPSPRRTWQTHKPICSACYCTSRAMITLPATALVREWPCLTHSLGSAHVLDPTSCWTLPSTMFACPQRGRKHSNKSLWATVRWVLLPTWSSLVGPMTSRWFLTHYAHTGKYQETLTIEDGLVLHGEALIIPPSERERIIQQLHQFHQGTTKAQLCTCGCVFWLGINKAIEEAVWQCETCTWFQAQNTAPPLTPMQTPSCPWQMCTTDIFTLEGINYLICGNFYSKMILVRCLPSGQSNTVKVVSLLKEMFSEHGIPKALCSDNGLQYAGAQFTVFCTSWGITHETSSPHYSQSNGFAEVWVKSEKHALQGAKYSGTNPQLTLLALWATPIDAKLL